MGLHVFRGWGVGGESDTTDFIGFRSLYVDIDTFWRFARNPSVLSVAPAPLAMASRQVNA